TGVEDESEAGEPVLRVAKRDEGVVGHPALRDRAPARERERREGREPVRGTRQTRESHDLLGTGGSARQMQADADALGSALSIPPHRRPPMPREAVIVESVRTGLTKAHRGSFNMTEPVDYTAHCLREVVARVPKLDPAEIYDVILGCGMPEGCQGMNMGR